MIIPCPEDLRQFTRYPLTLTLVALNIFIFMLIFNGAGQGLSSSSLLKKDGLVLTGRLYYQYLQSQSAEVLFQKPAWVHKLKSENLDHMAVLGAFALRDAPFLEMGGEQDYRGDQVSIAVWRKHLREFRSDYRKQLLYRFGLSSAEKSPLSWLTYQFSHSNWLHLLSNLGFLLFLGAAVEALAGSGFLLAIYILGGLAGGAGFLLSDLHGAVPMVGASASVSALLAFYCAAESRKRVRFLYFVSPVAGQYGAIFLPTLLIIPLFLVVDLASFWAAPQGFGGGVAYAAHLGGSLMGALAGVAYRWKFRGLLTQS